jgi:hypothetical protein
MINKSKNRIELNESPLNFMVSHRFLYRTTKHGQAHLEGQAASQKKPER